MPKKRYNAEEIIQKLREADVLLGQRQKCQPGLQADRCQLPDLLSLAQKLRRDETDDGRTARWVIGRLHLKSSYLERSCP